MIVNVIKEFKDKETKSILKPGIAIAVTEERFSELTAGPVFVVAIEKNEAEKDEAEEVEKEINLNELKNNELKEMLDKMGIEYKAKDTKEDLIALIVGD